jgi:hypothetical protein
MGSMTADYTPTRAMLYAHRIAIFLRSLGGRLAHACVNSYSGGENT